jgi:D-alanyl-lipoteichoic acid acyltransferase DltB (MBOAT superfamily)
MVFNSVHFAVFFVIVYAAYRAVGHRAQNWLLLAASYYFYAAWDWRFTSLLAASTLVSYVAALRLARTDDRRARTLTLWLCLGFHLLTLGFFKYYGFFAENFVAVFDAVGFRADFFTLHVILPLGISFYTFMAMAYVVDVYRREIPPSTDWLEYAVFVAYFPHLVAGPILRAPSLLPQIAGPRRVSRDDVAAGLWLVGVGLFKKMFVADNVGPVADAVFDPAHHAQGPEIVVGAYAFALQIYGDFSGYSDIARGLSRLMGIELNVNFRFPYFVRDARDFWRHWHISLSTWLRDYLYIPLGGSRGSAWATHRNLMITMALGGLWHGAAWPFVLWGAYQGLLLIAYREVEQRWASLWPRGWPADRLCRVGAWLLFIHLVCYGWLLFRARSLPQIAQMTTDLVWGAWRMTPALHDALLTLAAYGLPLIALNAYEAWKDDLLAVPRLPIVLRYAIYAAMFYLVLLFGQYGGAQFIYFQF